MLEPLPASQWNETTAAHLLNRAGFGGSPAEIDRLRQMGLGGAVSWFVNYERIPDETPAPDWAHPDPNYLAQRQAIQQAADPETKKALQRMQYQNEYQQMADLRYWWVRRMALGPRPFQEKMTLFWHGHFATSFEKVQSPFLLWQQNETLRQNATGNFYQILTAVAEDPAMLRYLDGAQSRKGKPNENFAREVLELFTLGEGHYTEQDIQQSAKAYTGWGIDRSQMSYEYHPSNHDNGPKTVFGQTGNFTGEDVLNLICDNPQCAKFITGKIWRFFVQDQPPEPVIDALAADFHSHGMDLKHLMTTIFSSKEFYAPDVIRSQIKSPVQWLIASTHQLEAPLPTQPMTLVMLAQLGQELFQPPNVKGWDGGIAWITTNSLMDRYNFAAALVEGQRVPLPGLMGQMRSVMHNNVSENNLMELSPVDVNALFTPVQLVDSENFLAALEARFINGTLGDQRQNTLQDFLKHRSPIEEIDIRKAIRLIMCTPEYQLT
ncbi:MAG: DUF1800 domain-containing protein [Methylacidiphilales bacterium]|nr:DUF1800 domain-containing protein [Candidatus Methylacidiphilales bacterium]